MKSAGRVLISDELNEIFTSLDKERLSDLNPAGLKEIIMDYFVVMGFKEAASAFQVEANVNAKVEMESVDTRKQILRDIRNRDILGAIEKINDLNPRLLEENKDLYFRLQLQQMLELIQRGNYMKVVSYAHENVAPICGNNPVFLQEMERIMLFLLYINPRESPEAHLLSEAHREDTARMVNSAILASQLQDQDPTLLSLLQLLILHRRQIKNIASNGSERKATSLSTKIVTKDLMDES